MLALLLIAQAIAQKPPSGAAATVDAKAVVRIERGTRARAEDWDKPTEGQRREVWRQSEDGQPLKLRLIEHQ